MGDAIGGILSPITGLLGMTPKPPDTVPQPNPADEQKKVDDAAISARKDRQRRAVLSSGKSSTIKNSGGKQGLESPTTKKTVLGA